MRFIVFCIFIGFSYFGQADELLLPDNIKSDTQDTTNQYVSSAPTKTAPRLSAAAAAELVEKKYSGQIMSVTLQENNAKYRVKILKTGHMKTIYVNANTGQLSKLSD